MGTTKSRMISDLKLANRADATIREYVAWAYRFVAFHRKPAESLGAADVRRWLHHLADSKRASVSTRKMAFAAVRWLYVRTLARPEVVAGIPWPRVPRPLTDCLTPEEVRALIRAADRPRTRVAIQLAYCAGLRISEIARLSVDQIDSKRGVLRVRCGKGGKDRLAPLSPALLTGLRAYWREVRPPGPLLFPGQQGGPISTGALRDGFHRALRSSGLEARGRRLTFHTLRHAFATHQLQRGGSVATIQTAMGHASISTTGRYLHVDSRLIAGLPDLLG